MAEQVYTVRNWDSRFETAQSRKVKSILTWVALPVKHDGLGFRRIMALPDGPAIYGAWVLIVQVAAKCPVRGVLADENGPLGPEDLELKTGCSVDVFSRALNVLSGNKIGWIVVADYQCGSRALSLQDSTEQDITEDIASPVGDLPPGLLDFIHWWNALRAEGMVPHSVNSDPPSNAVVKAWTRSRKSSELRTLLADRDALSQAIRDAEFCREGWFRLEKLFGAKNRDGEYIVRKLLEGAYRTSARQKASIPSGRSKALENFR
jgi:hypothetical protein